MPATLPPTTALADVLQLHGLDGWLSPPLRPVAVTPIPVVGPALTVALGPGPGPQGVGLTPIHELLSDELAGAVLVVAGATVVPGAVWGEILSIAAHQVGAVAVLVDGQVRDAGATADVGIPVWALGLATAGPGGQAHVTAVREPVVVGSTSVTPGERVVVDADGVVRLPTDREGALLRDALEYAEAETAVVAALRAGEPLRHAYRHKKAAIAAIRARMEARS
jgi:4-hydroxy-4-methyl-2-oxoglutarate aldolase